MKTEKPKLTLESFKANAAKKIENENLASISGGILGACHCVVAVYYIKEGSTVYKTTDYQCEN